MISRARRGTGSVGLRPTPDSRSVDPPRPIFVGPDARNDWAMPRRGSTPRLKVTTRHGLVIRGPTRGRRRAFNEGDRRSVTP